jgi:hypothetical protein
MVNNLHLLYTNQGKHEDAEEMYMRTLQGYKEALRLKDMSTLDTTNNLGGVYRN